MGPVLNGEYYRCGLCIYPSLLTFQVLFAYLVPLEPIWVEKMGIVCHALLVASSH